MANINLTNLQNFVNNANEILYNDTSLNGKTLKEVVNENEGKSLKKYDSTKYYEEGTIVVNNGIKYMANKANATDLLNDFVEITTQNEELFDSVVVFDVYNGTFVQKGRTDIQDIIVSSADLSRQGLYYVTFSANISDDTLFFISFDSDSTNTYTLYNILHKSASDKLTIVFCDTNATTSGSYKHCNFQLFIKKMGV